MNLKSRSKLSEKRDIKTECDSGRIINYDLQKRDILMLAYLAQQGVAYSQHLIDVGRFQSRNAFYQRIGILKQAGLIQSRRLNSNQKKVRKSIYLLSNTLQKKCRNARALSVKSMWKHQLKLNDLRKSLDLAFPKAPILVEGHIRYHQYSTGASVDEALPDLVLHWEDKKIAIEMERTLKWDKDRYYAKWLAYQKLSYDKVIYFCSDDEMRNRLCQLGEKFERIGFSTLFDYEWIHTSRFGVDPIKSFILRENLMPYREVEL